MNELTMQCLALPYNERQSLLRQLQESLRQDNKDEGRLSMLLKVAEEVVGCSILTKRRDFLQNVGRRMFAYQARQEGYSLMTIGRRMGRHHASVIHMTRMQEDIFRYPSIFKLEMVYWDEFIKKIAI